ncbi:MAG: hypothetical protein JNJ83_16575 [Verrucomicrobiaceae bacterium]|nr:hypothetical protein [Verrucomicrobiaceae bacterium]
MSIRSNSCIGRGEEQAGFISHGGPFEPKSGRNRPPDARFCLSDDYLRFYSKYIDPMKARITKGLLKVTALESLGA